MVTSSETSRASSHHPAKDHTEEENPEITTTLVSPPAHLLNALELNMPFLRTNVSTVCQDLIARLVHRYQGLDLSHQHWHVGPSRDGVQVEYAQVPGTPWYTLRSIMSLGNNTADHTFDRIKSTLENPHLIPRYDHMVEQVDVLETLDAQTQIRLVSAKRVMLTSRRDFCVLTTSAMLPDGRFVIATRSVDHEDARDRASFVRAKAMLSGYIVSLEDSGRQIDISLIVHFDFGGYMPPAVMRFLGFSAPISLLCRLRQLLLEEELS